MTKQRLISYKAVLFVILSTVGIYLLSQVGAIIILSLYTAFRGWNAEQANAWLNSSVPANFALILLVAAFSVAIVYWLLQRSKHSLSSIGLTRPKAIDGAYAIAGFAFYIVIHNFVVVLLSSLLPAFDADQSQELLFNTGTTGPALILIFFSLALLPPLYEEIVMRGYLFSGLRKQLPYWMTAVIVSILFGIAHLQFGSGNSLLWVAAVDTFVLSLILVQLRETTGRLWAPIGLHFIKNSLAFFVLFILKA